MTVHIGTYEAKARLSELLERVEKGEDVIITRHGKPVAKLVKPDVEADEERKLRARQAAENMRKLRAGLPQDVLGGVSIRDLIEEGRR